MLNHHKNMEWRFTDIIRGRKRVYQSNKKCQYKKAKLITFTLIKNQSYFKVVCACAIKSANYASYKNWTSESIISYIQNVLKNFIVNMYYVNIKINKKNTISLTKRIVTFLHCSFPAIVFGREGYGCGTLRWVGCDSDCFLSLFTLDSNQHIF